MSTLLYDNPMLLDSVRHADLRLKDLNDLSFAAHTNTIPINLVEFPLIARHYPIGFVGEGKDATPMAIVGLGKENLFIDEKGQWKPGVYIPAYVRRYPFIFGAGNDPNQLSLCIEDSPNVLTKVGGKPLFEDGKPSDATERALEFCRSFHNAALSTEPFAKALHGADLLTERQANAELNGGGAFVLKGFKSIDEAKLRKVTAKTLGQWNEKNWLTPIFASIQSTLNWSNLVDLMAERNKAAVN
ncbi:MAG: SapC family protein [Caulobacteraceae bacterium]|nr:SapC family protein [Caulobacteraceae bacterium]